MDKTERTASELLVILTLDAKAGSAVTEGKASALTVQGTEIDTESLAAELTERMRSSVVPFIYKKADGSYRWAIGTLDPKHFPQKTAGAFSDLMTQVERVIKRKKLHLDLTADIEMMEQYHGLMVKDRVDSMEKTKALHLVTYYDLEAMAWRSFKKEQLVFVLSTDTLRQG